jgi:DNA-binding response OmpR family regulator
MHILVAEDDPSLAALEAELLADEGYSVTLAPTPERARELARARSWSAVLVDTFGRRHAELEAADRSFFRAMAASGPVIVVSARPGITRLRPAELGAAAIVAKPFDVDDLLDTIRVVSSWEAASGVEPFAQPPCCTLALGRV